MTAKNKNGSNKNGFKMKKREKEKYMCVCVKMMIHTKLSNRSIVCDILDKKQHALKFHIEAFDIVAVRI